MRGCIQNSGRGQWEKGVRDLDVSSREARIGIESFSSIGESFTILLSKLVCQNESIRK